MILGREFETEIATAILFRGDRHRSRAEERVENDITRIRTGLDKDVYQFNRELADMGGFVLRDVFHDVHFNDVLTIKIIPEHVIGGSPFLSISDKLPDSPIRGVFVWLRNLVLVESAFILVL